MICCDVDTQWPWQGSVELPTSNVAFDVLYVWMYHLHSTPHSVLEQVWIEPMTGLWACRSYSSGRPERLHDGPSPPGPIIIKFSLGTFKCASDSWTSRDGTLRLFISMWYLHVQTKLPTCVHRWCPVRPLPWMSKGFPFVLHAGWCPPPAIVYYDICMVFGVLANWHMLVFKTSSQQV